jgi:hypothetical protein
MKFNDPEGHFPKFKNYLVFDFGQLASNRAIVNGMQKWGKMSSDQAKSYIIPGSGPMIIVMDDKDFFINQTVGFPTSLNLSFIQVHKFEIKETLPPVGPRSAVVMTGNGKRLYRVGLEILEALIRGHLSKFSDEVDDRNSSKVLMRLDAFEEEVYGGVNPDVG